MNILKRFFGVFDPATDHSESLREARTETAEGLSIQVDQPIKSVAEDVFDRASFAKQIAETISRRRDPSS